MYSSTLIILSKNLKIYWLHRGNKAPFLPDYHCFTGGMLKKAEPSQEHLKNLAWQKAKQEISYPFSQHRINQWMSLGLWHTHPYLHTQMETHFYLDFLDDFDAEDLCFETDLSHFHAGQWVSLEHVYEAWQKADLLIAPPTLFYIKALSELIQNLGLKDQHVGSKAELRQEIENGFFEKHPLKAELQFLNPIRPYIHVFPLKTPTLPPATHTNCYLIGKEKLVIVDPGAILQSEIDRLGLHLKTRFDRSPFQIVGILLTHHHVDHISGVLACQKLLTETFQQKVPIFAHLETAKEVDFEVDIELEEGKWHIGDSSVDLEILHTPGHAKGHFCIWDHQSHTAIVGDMVAGTGTILIDPYEGDMQIYLKQLQRLSDLNLRALLPSHGAPIGATTEYLSFYIQHRLNREKKILNALSFEKRRSLSRIVEEAYQNTPLVMRKGPNGGIAGLSALAHLLKLQKEGYATCENDLWLRRPKDELEMQSFALFQQEQDTLIMAEKLSTLIKELVWMMSELRAHCAWNKEQDLQSLKRYLLEETSELYEVMSSTTTHGMVAHKTELADVFLQILFQSQIRQEEAQFSLVEVLLTLKEKMIRRHPHVFHLNPSQGEIQQKTLSEIRRQYLQIKEQEQEQEQEQENEAHQVDLYEKFKQQFQKLSQCQPFLLRAQLISEKAAEIGFDWPSWEGSFLKVQEEVLEVKEAIELNNHDQMLDEIGDLFFAIVNLSRHLKIDPNIAVHQSIQKFQHRFLEMLRLSAHDQKDFSALSLDEKEKYWGKAKIKS
jgi:MazG family protein